MSQKKSKLTRRDFLKCGGMGTLGLMAAGLMATGPAQAASKKPSDDEPWGILIDLTRCTGCNSCAQACKEANNLPHPDIPPTELSSSAYTYLERFYQSLHIEGQGNESWAESQYVKRQCMHCLHPACVSACTVGALEKTAEGPVIYNSHKCIGCRYCQYACPFGVPAYDWNNPLGLIHKCEMCVSRLAEGQKPACVESCPNGTLRFDKRSALLAQARAQIASNPDRYIDQIYGEHEAGGTSVLYLSAIPFAKLGFPQVQDEPIPHYAESVMKMTPFVALTVASGATALHWLLKRRSGDEHQYIISSQEDEQQGGNS